MMKAGLFQYQTLKLTMTQDLSQAIALLQYSSQELSAFLENKSMENPLLSLNQSHTQALRSDYGSKKRKSNKVLKSDSNSKNWIEQIGQETSSLEEHLLSQLDLKAISEPGVRLFRQMIRNLDENGYLRINVDEAAAITGFPETDIEECIALLHELEPPGIGARHLKECLLIQIRRDGNRLAERIISEDFFLFADKKWKQLSKKLSVPVGEIQKAYDYIKTLNPRPGAVFYNEKAAYITPDVTVEYKNNEYSISLYEAHSSGVSLNEGYFNQMKSHGDSKVDQFLQEKWQEYQWISRAITQRRETILNVMKIIVKRQGKYFSSGPSFLLPMTMKDVADELGVHESTVSRAVKDKYVQTSFGTVEMRCFFTSTLQAADHDISSETAKHAIQAIIKSENKLKPVSDQDVCNILKDSQGIILSRRTVAKYREQLGIPSSSKRRRYEN
ncbi:RNA polymerase factor sigma-54 [Peribacillus sp. SCS-155]|uniref:RNA polymerase factor sigma-54 n=1 Tax=Peribacillus sedimenti TaxID=3115297 RepID=UPI003905FBEC